MKFVIASTQKFDSPDSPSVGHESLEDDVADGKGPCGRSRDMASHPSWTVLHWAGLDLFFFFFQFFMGLNYFLA